MLCHAKASQNLDVVILLWTYYSGLCLFIEIDVHLKSGYVSQQQPPADKDK